ncbi:sphingomyelin phosphodiesterase 5 isoform X2 [Procambarus clarkii]|uniref:sphingomyelin phosphodiesterase 5 isoform X2 n=1 Tax=Procambarus clarkii TaxID=6728 RepID=UPI001E66FED1|nr:sphingomyelin phosphodiesterase 3-like isoform X1 [Procambarus clarkii]
MREELRRSNRPGQEHWQDLVIMGAPRASRYTHWPWDALDTLTCILMTPFQQLISLSLSCYCFTNFDKSSLSIVIVRYAVLGPILFLLTLCTAPFAAVGYIMWVLINLFTNIQPFYYVSPKNQNPRQESQCPSRFTICSANVILSPEIFVRINKNRNVYWRVFEVARRLLCQDPLLNQKQNLQTPVNREAIVESKLPDVDVFILQEVFERVIGVTLIKQLKQKYPFIIYDVGRHCMETNYFCLGSGLFLASRYPVLEACFHPFTYCTKFGKFLSYGMLLTKLDLGLLKKRNEELHAVGYVANLHTQAYQGEDKVLVHQLEQTRLWMNTFIQTTHNTRTEIVVFAIIGGDFNCDNLSPGDVGTQNLPLWDEYEDPCRESAGNDKPWTIGTELRQCLIHHSIAQNPESFRKILLDDIQRRHYILDADVKEQAPDLMWIAPKADSSGRVRAVREGGRRRIDYLIARHNDEATPSAFWFCSVMAGLSDHIPIALMVERK